MDKRTNLILIWSVAIVIIAFFVYIVVTNIGPGSLNNDELGKINKTDYTWGNPEALVTIIEYSDLQCPACAYIHSSLIKPLLEDYGDKVHYAFRHFPLKNIHPQAVAAARALEAAGAQGKFWEMQDILFESQEEWSNKSDPKEKFNVYAQDLGLNLEKFKTDSSSSKYLKLIEDSYDFAVDNGLNYTPSIVLNGELIDNPKSVDEFKAVIDGAINNAS
ncbi:thioredoxin domain-containing protein [Candidatus Peregrinibacteria bacterium]|nr:thioredoxin domain-containing protein [Candidatus Peregrinibacteria bacterium]